MSTKKFLLGNVKGPQGETGNGIESVEQTTVSTEDSGTNEVTLTMTDGSTQVVQIRNGSQGSQGLQGIQGIQGIPGTVPSVTISGAVDTDTSQIIDIAYDGLAASDGVRVSVFFLGACTGSNTPTISINGGDTAYSVKVPKDGALADLTSHDIDDVTTWWQAYTQFELQYIASEGVWCILNNPVVLSSSDSTTGYTIKADGSSVYRAYLKTKNQTLTSQTVDAGAEVSWSISPTGITGYTAVGVVGHYTGHTFFIVDVVRLINGVIQMIGRNSASVQLTIAPEVTVLYQRI